MSAERPPHPGFAIGVFGDSRPDLEWIALALAKATDGEFTWVQIGISGILPESRELEVLEQIGLDRIDRADRRDLCPDEAAANLAQFVAGERGSPTGVSDLGPTMFQLPSALLSRLAEPEAGPTTLVLANVDRTLDLVARPVGYLRQVITFLRGRGTNSVFTLGGAVGDYASLFTGLIEVGASPSPSSFNPSVTWSAPRPPDHVELASVPDATSAHDLVHRLRRKPKEPSSGPNPA